MAGKTSFRQFGIRTLLLIVGLAALGCLLIRNEMAREERREKLIAELEEQGTTWHLFAPAGPAIIGQAPQLWREPIAAWLRGKPMVPPRAWAMFGKGTTPQQLREFLDLFPSVRMVEIDGDTATDGVLELLASRASLDDLTIANPLTIDAKKARLLAQIKCNKVRISGQECFDATLQNLADAGVKVELYFGLDEWRNVGDEGLTAVAKLPKLRYVHANCLGTDEGVLALAGHPSVELFFMTGRNYTDASADVIPTLTMLRQLRIVGTSHTDAGLAKAIAGCNATHIELVDVAVGDQTIAALLSATRLTDLTLNGVDLSGEQCDALAKLPLRRLDISGDKLANEQVARLAPLAKTLSYFYVKAPEVTDDGLMWLKQAQGLTVLHLNDTQATAAMWSSLPFAASLQKVGMGGTNFDTETIACTANMSSLKSVVLTGHEIDDATLDLLPQGLTTFFLSDTRVTADGLKKLALRKGIVSISIYRDKDPVSLITPADVKEAQSLAGPKVQVTYEETALHRCE